MSKYLTGELVVHKLSTVLSITDEYESTIDLEFPMIEPVKFSLMGNDYEVQKVVVRSKWLEDGLELSYVINGYTPELPVSDELALEVIEVLEANYGDKGLLGKYNFEDDYESWLSDQAWVQWGEYNA